MNNQSSQILKPPTQSLGIMSSCTPPTPNSPILQPSDMLGFNQFKMNNPSVLPILSTPSTGNGLKETTPAHSASTTPTLTIGNNGFASPMFDQPGHSQQLVQPGKVTVSIVAVRDPFGSQSATSQPSLGHLASASWIQHGISSISVSDKRAAAQVSSHLISRRLPLRPLKLHARKYNQKSDGSKVPFFDNTEKTENKLELCNSVIPRKNPRSVFGNSTVQTHVTCLKDGASSLNSVYENPALQKAKKDQSHHSKSTSFDNHFNEVQGALKEVEEPINENPVESIKPLTPKVQRSDYFREPGIQELVSAEQTYPGYSTHVKDFVVGRHGYGWIKFNGVTDVSGLDLDAIVHFNNREVIVYNDDSEKPPIGQGLNKAAEVTLLNIKCMNKKTGEQCSSNKMVDKLIEKLKKVCQEQGAEFVSYDLVRGEWKFRVGHFSCYGFSDE